MGKYRVFYVCQLGGGFKDVFYVHPETWGNDPKLTIIFLRWVVQPPTSIAVVLPKKNGGFWMLHVFFGGV